MKRLFLTLAAVVALGSLANAEEWLTDYAQALSLAKTQNKPVLIDFTGSDWCGWCMKLDREVFKTSEFKSYAAQNLILLKADFPRSKPLPSAEKEQNERLASKYHIQGYPTIVLLKPDGAKAGELGYEPGGPHPFIESVKKVTAR